MGNADARRSSTTPRSSRNVRTSDTTATVSAATVAKQTTATITAAKSTAVTMPRYRQAGGVPGGGATRSGRAEAAQGGRGWVASASR